MQALSQGPPLWEEAGDDAGAEHGVLSAGLEALQLQKAAGAAAGAQVGCEVTYAGESYMSARVGSVGGMSTKSRACDARMVVSNGLTGLQLKSAVIEQLGLLGGVQNYVRRVLTDLCCEFLE